MTRNELGEKIFGMLLERFDIPIGERVKLRTDLRERTRNALLKIIEELLEVKK